MSLCFGMAREGFTVVFGLGSVGLSEGTRRVIVVKARGGVRERRSDARQAKIKYCTRMYCYSRLLLAK